MSQFKVGDIVECISNDAYYNYPAIVGQRYIVIKIQPEKNQLYVIWTQDGFTQMNFMVNHFKLVIDAETGYYEDVI